jgi:hypothetical protein
MPPSILGSFVSGGRPGKQYKNGYDIPVNGMIKLTFKTSTIGWFYDI